MMSRLNFNSQGKLESVEGVSVQKIQEDLTRQRIKLKKSMPRVFEKVDNSKDSEYWSLYNHEKKLEPLKFSNGKNQEDVVKEVVELINSGVKCIFLHGMCGTGKSAIALNIARVLGKTSIVVPVKNLQSQYEEDYTENMYVVKKTGMKMKIDIITGRDNHDSIIKPGVSCADPFLPDTIQIVEKNAVLLKEFYNENPLVGNKEIEDVKSLKRISIAPSNPYWSPIIPADYELQLRDAKKKRYLGLNAREFIFYHRKNGCSYYDQYQAYIDSDVIIFNSAKYKIEVALDRKPLTEVDIIDEADEFLDSFSNQIEINLTRLSASLSRLIISDLDVMAILDTIKELISLEEKNKRATGIDEDKIHFIGDTQIGKILKLFLKDRNVESEISMDDLNYAGRAVEAAKQFIDFLDETYLTYRKDEENNLYVNLVTTNLSKNLKKLLDKGKAFVFMSGTLHSEEVLKKIFGIENYKTVYAESKYQGIIELHRTGLERDCSYKSFNSGNFTRKDYLTALKCCIDRAQKPFLVHVNAFDDLPNNHEIYEFGLNPLISGESLYLEQQSDREGKQVSLFKKGVKSALYSTKCSRGVDFPGDTCRSVILTKYPNPNIRGTFWKVLKNVHPDYFWDFYQDKARREFLQRIFRALRSKEDHVFVLSPDIRVIEAVKQLQNGM